MTAYNLENFYEIASTLTRIQLPEDVLNKYDKLVEDLNINIGQYNEIDNKERK